MILQLDNGFYCAGVEFNERGKMIRCAPILRNKLRWMSFLQVMEYCVENNVKFKVI